MKKILAMLVLLTGLVSFRDIPVNDVNEKVLKAFQEVYGDAKDVVWNEYNTYYEVKFSQSAISARLKYDENGNIMEAYRYYSGQMLPPFILSKLVKKHSDKKIYGVTEFTKEGSLEYFITMEDAENWYTIHSDSYGSMEVQKKFKKA